MSAEQLSEFFEAVLADAGLREQLGKIDGLDAATRIAKKAGFNITKEDWLEAQARQMTDPTLEIIFKSPYYYPDVPLRIWAHWIAMEKGCLALSDKSIQLRDSRQIIQLRFRRPPQSYNLD